MGSGKNYLGSKLATELDIPFFDGDTVIPPHDFFVPIDSPFLLWPIKKVGFKPFHRSKISHYSRFILGPAIVEEANGSDLVIAQGLYFDDDRKFLIDYLQEQGYEVQFYLVSVPFWRNIKQLFYRNGIGWVIYWLLTTLFFQKPTHNYIQC